MATRVIKGTLDTFSVNSGSDVTYLGTTSAATTGGINIRGFRINPATTGDIIVKLDKSQGIQKIQIFQEDAIGGSSAPTGYKTVSFVERDGKGKGAVAVTVTNASKDYVCLLTLDGYSEVSYNGTVVTP